MRQHTVLLSAPYMNPFIERFRPVFAHYDCDLIVPEVHERMSAKEILAYAGQFDGTICGDDRYTSDVISACAPRLKIISKWGTGIDSIDKDAAEQNGIAVCRTANAFTKPVSDSVMAYVLAFARKQPWMDRLVKSAKWKKIPGRSLCECTIGVIGVGNIGKAVLKKAYAFEMRLIANDIIEVPADFTDAYAVEMMGLDQLLQQADFVSINCDLNPTSYHLINSHTLAGMNPHAVLINTARGPIIDEQALISALQSGAIAGAALDVFEVEPLPANSPLRVLDQVMLAPHNSNSSPSAWEAVHWNTIRNLLNGLQIPLEDFEEVKKQYEEE